MHRLFRLVAATVLVVVLCGAGAWADGINPPGNGSVLARLKTVLNLSVEQVRALAPVLQVYYKRHHERLQALHGLIRTVLTPDQATRFEEIRKLRRQGRGGERRGLKGLQEDLGLSEEQVARIRTLAREVREKARADHEAFMTRMKSILTTEQFAQFEQIMRRPGSEPSASPRGGH